MNSHTPPFSTPRGQSGVSIISAIFLLLLFAGLAAFMASMMSTANITSAQDVQGARAYQAARAGVEWGLYQVLDPLNGTVQPTMPSCPAGAACTLCPGCAGTCTTLPLIDGFTVEVACNRLPGAATSYQEADQLVTLYELVATARSGAAPGPSSFIERQIAVTASKCRSPSSTEPGNECQ